MIVHIGRLWRPFIITLFHVNVRCFSGVVISVAEIKSAVCHRPLRIILRSYQSSGAAARGASPLSARWSFLSTQSTQADHQWSSPCDCPLCIKCACAHHYCHHSEVSSGREGLCSNEESRLLDIMLSTADKTDFNSFNSAYRPAQ